MLLTFKKDLLDATKYGQLQLKETFELYRQSCLGVLTLLLFGFVMFRSWTLHIGYWSFLGFISSAGFGFGIPTGILVLFPYLLTLNSKLTPWKAFLSGYPTAFVWGVGTATGEIFPYAVARQVSHVSLDHLKWNPNSTWGQYVMKPINFIFIDSTFWLVKKGGVYALIFLASWPNMAFDICGIACGASGMPWSDFLCGLYLGKAAIKPLLEVLFLLLLHSNSSFQWLPDSVRNWGPLLWNVGVLGCFIKFFLVCIHEMAELYREKRK